ncbi:MAG: hypothetical protein JJU29_01550 [Verrucomicrobia bacterium]|nr:hypothetical protein [Verrucomicrobiota bacterium]MCH8512791.1 hypothetical protein [Kiritimatiellia bacterium]
MNTQRKILHLVSQAHLDPVWLWPLRDGVAESLTTLQSAADRADETPSFQFTRSSACTYRWARELDPALFARIRALVEAGHWEVVGGWIEQPDCNLPSAESFLRQSLYGKTWLREALGPKGDTDIGYNVDSFGHAAGLPQLLRHTGYSRYVFMRPQPDDDDEVPLLFFWESPDGSRVLAQRIPGLYAQSYAASPDEVEATIRRAATEFFVPGFRNGVMWFGVGNHGGGPTREHIRRVLDLQNDESLPEIRFSTLREYFDAVEAEAAMADLPVLRRELNGVFRGCYSSHRAIKHANRQGEQLLFKAEALQFAAERHAPKELHDAWWELLFNQFHDILAGTCTAQSERETLDRAGAVVRDARDSIRRSVFARARRVDTRGESGSVLFVANSLPWSRTALVEFDTFQVPHGIFSITHLETQDGSRIPIQWQHADANLGPWGLPWAKLTARVKLPPCGHRVFRIAGHPVERKADNSFEARAADQQFFRSSEELAEDASEVRKPLSLPCPYRLRVLRDTSGAWGHGVTAYQEDLGEPEHVDHRVVESGEVLTLLRDTYRWGTSEIWVDQLHLTGESLVELRIHADWHEKRQLLKIAFDTGLSQTALLTRGGGSLVRRDCDGSEQVCADWAALEGADGALVVLNNGVHACAAVEGRLEFTLLRAAPFAEHAPFNYTDDTHVHFLDQGLHDIRLGLLRGKSGALDLHPDRRATEFQNPPEIVPDSAHAGDLSWEQSGLEITPASVQVLALKAAEAGRGWILRLQETRGETVTATVGDYDTCPLTPHEIATLRLTEEGRILKSDGMEQ